MKSQKSSKRGRVRVAYEKHGEKAAIDMGDNLGVRASKVRRWIKMWTGGKIERLRPKRDIDAQRPPAPPKRKKPAAYVEEGDMVCMTWNADLVGKLIRKGPEQSEVKFINGNVRVVVNEWIAPADQS